MSEALKNHPAADLFPMMDDARLSELRADIQANGQHEPITLYDGMILDGRHRYRACVELGIEPRLRQYDGDPWAFAWSLNGARRDLEATVRALIFKRCEEGSAKWTERLAKIAAEGNRKKSEAAASRPRDEAGRLKANPEVDHRDPPVGKKHVAREARAAEAKVSPATMARADQIAKRPDLERKVVAGEMKPAEALRQIRSQPPLSRSGSPRQRQPAKKAIKLIAGYANAFLDFHPKRAAELEALLVELVTRAREVMATREGLRKVQPVTGPTHATGTSPVAAQIPLS